MLFVKLGMPGAFGVDSVSSVRVKNFHIKYHGEARPGDPLRIESGILSLHEKRAHICHMMFHLNGRLAASVVETVSHVCLHSWKSFAWSSRVKAAAKAYTVKPPLPSKPRGVDYATRSDGVTKKRLKKLGLKPVGLGVFQPSEIGVQGYVTVQAYMGRITETVSSVTSGWPELHDPGARENGHSGALLEARGFLHKRAAAGDAYQMYSGVVKVDQYTRQLVHHLVDATSGKSLFSLQAVGCLFDLNTRKLMKATPEQIARIESQITPGLGV